MSLKLKQQASVFSINFYLGEDTHHLKIHMETANYGTQFAILGGKRPGVLGLHPLFLLQALIQPFMIRELHYKLMNISTKYFCSKLRHCQWYYCVTFRYKNITWERIYTLSISLLLSFILSSPLFSASKSS